MGKGPLVVSGVIQGLGLGFVFVPLSTLAFATLEPRLRTDATSLFSLMRNLGSSVGISMVATLLAQNIQVNHASLAEHVTPMSRVLDGAPMAQLGEAALPVLVYLDAEITRQAAMIAYLNDFRLMMVVTLAAAPLLLFLRRPQAARAGAPAPVME
jgi:DHA2 family multidrug resistance protein